jgi:hypothetical protein
MTVWLRVGVDIAETSTLTPIPEDLISFRSLQQT